MYTCQYGELRIAEMPVKLVGLVWSCGAPWLPKVGSRTVWGATPSDGGFCGIVTARSDCAMSTG